MTKNEWEIILHTMKAIAKKLKEVTELIDSMIKELMFYRNGGKK